MVACGAVPMRRHILLCLSPQLLSQMPPWARPTSPRASSVSLVRRSWMMPAVSTPSAAGTTAIFSIREPYLGLQSYTFLTQVHVYKMLRHILLEHISVMYMCRYYDMLSNAIQTSSGLPNGTDAKSLAESNPVAQVSVHLLCILRRGYMDSIL